MDATCLDVFELGSSFLGVREHGRLAFNVPLFDPRELLTAPSAFSYLDVKGHQQQIELGAGSLAYLICQTPVVLEAANETCITMHFANGTHEHVNGTVLDEINSKHIFQRDSVVHHLTVSFPSGEL